MKPHELNRLALWLPMKSDKLDTKVYNDGYPYTKKGIINKSDMLNPIIRYAKNYIIGDFKFSLCMISNEKDMGRIESWLDEQSKNIKETDVNNKFELLDIYYQ